MLICHFFFKYANKKNTAENDAVWSPDPKPKPI